MIANAAALHGGPLSLAQLIETLETAAGMDPQRAADLLRRLRATPADFSQWHDFDHPVRDSYGRRLVARGPNFELMVMSWLPGDYSAIHDHGIAEWGAVRFFAPADHVAFETRNGRLCVMERCTTEDGLVFAVAPSLIHMMGNPGATPFITVHLYGRTEAATSITGGARIFDLWEDRIQRTNGGVFYCLPEDDIVCREACLAADTHVTLIHHQAMLARVERILAVEGHHPDLAQRAAVLRLAMTGGNHNRPRIAA